VAPDRKELLQAHEDLIATARIFGLLLSRRGTALEELEEAAGQLEAAALAYARARQEAGPCEWVVEDPVMAQEGRDISDFIESSRGLYEAAEALFEMAEVGGAAVQAARTILGQAAARFYEESRHIVAYAVTLRRGGE
jgi:hypothetical protein